MIPESTFLEILKLIVAIAGGIGLAWYWNWKKDLLEKYRHLDECYNTLLQAYFEVLNLVIEIEQMTMGMPSRIYRLGNITISR